MSSPPSDTDDAASIIDVTQDVSTSRPGRKYDLDLHFPHYWTEVLSPISKTFVPVDPIVLFTVGTNQELLATFEPRGKRADQSKQVMCYTVAHSPDGSAKDVTVRYLRKHQLPGRTKSYRMPVEKIKIHNRRGKILRYEDYDWFKTVMSCFQRPAVKRTEADDLEESTDLKPFKPVEDKSKLEQESLQWYKQSAEFVLERHLRREEAIASSAKSVKTFMNGKGDKATEEPVFLRKHVVACKTAESWHKEGREIKVGEQPMKLVNMRAVTLMRKREMEDIERETGEKAKQGLFGKSQTDWIIPPPIGPDRQIPINAFNNIDVYTPSMVPKGAVHIPLKGTARICKDMGISFAEACTGFEFGKRMAIPVITGVVVAEENEDAVIDAWEIREAERRRKEDIKREQVNLQLWRKFVMGMRIIERMRTEYAGSGSTEEEINPFVNKAKQRQAEGHAPKKPKDEEQLEPEDDNMGGGGFFRPGEDDDDGDDGEAEEAESAPQDDVDMDTGGGFLLDGADDDTHELASAKKTATAPIIPLSLQSAARSKIEAEANPLTSVEEQPARPDPPSRKKSTSARKAALEPRAHQKQTKPAQKPMSASKPKKSKRKQATPSSEEDGSEDESANLLDPSDASSETDSSTAATTPPSAIKSVVSGQKTAGTKPGSRSAKGKKEKVKSPYFRRGSSKMIVGDEDQVDEDEDQVDEDEEDDEEETEQEVIKPRATTARTRGRR